MGSLLLLVLLFLATLIVIPIWTLFRLRSLQQQYDAVTARLRALEQELRTLRPPPPPSSPPTLAPFPSEPPPQPAPASSLTTFTAPPPSSAAAPTPPPLAEPPVISPAPAATPPLLTPPPLAPRPPSHSAAPAPAPRHTPALNLEHFVGAKLFAWLGGLTAFLAVAFFIKYSFEHDLIPAEIRVAIGFVLGAALVAAGLRITADKYRVLSQVLCATGIVSLYAVTYACHDVYHFPFFTPLATFLLMVLLTATAFLLAVRLNAPVVALLGLVAGFLTPILVSTGRDNPPALFSYIALLDLGLIAVALHRRWHYLIALAAAGTIILQIAWVEKFFSAPRAALLVTISLSFSALFALAAELGRRWQRPSIWTTRSAAALPLMALAFAASFLGSPAISAQAGLLFSFIFAADLFLLLLAWRDELAPRIHLLAGAIVFTLLAAWTALRLSDALLPWALGAFLVFAVFHTAFPLLLQRKHPTAPTTLWSQFAPPLALGLIFLPLLKLDDIPLLVWPVILILDVIAVALALSTASLTALTAVLVLTFAATALCIFKISPLASDGTSLLALIGGFSLFFFAAGLLLARRLALGSNAGNLASPRFFGGPGAQIPALSALLPFALLVMITLRLPLANPSPLFAVALLLVLLVLGLTRLLTLDWLPACALAGLAAVEYASHAQHFTLDRAPLALGWYLGFYALFTVFPFVFRRHFLGATGPWAVAALAGVAQFPLAYQIIKHTWPNDFMGAVPATFALAPLVSLVALLRQPSPQADARLNQTAWFGGVALLFITLIVPIQFERQWITLAWALEGAALLWLFHRVPHPGLRATGVALLVIAFTRLALNPAVFSYHVRTDTPLFNWYLYAYGLTILCLALGAKLLPPPRARVFGLNAHAILNTLATVLAFLLLNLEIADYFSPPGSTLIFEFSGSFARDVAYTVAWAIFALGLLGVGIWKKTRAARLAAISLLGVTLLKLFLHDLSQLPQLYRVGALVAVAIVAIVASFLYQRFAPSGDAASPDGS